MDADLIQQIEGVITMARQMLTLRELATRLHREPGTCLDDVQTGAFFNDFADRLSATLHQDARRLHKQKWGMP